MLDKPLALPLQNKRILVTRTREQASVMSEKLTSLGATPVEFPTIRIVPAEPSDQLDAFLHALYAPTGAGYGWWVLTSANGVRICCDRLLAAGHDPAALQDKVRIATIGPATAEALTHYGLTADLLPEAYIAEGVVAAIREDAQRQGYALAGKCILLTRAAEARKVLATELEAAGAVVDDIAAYHTLPVSWEDERGKRVLALLQQQQLDILTFTSSSTVRNFVAWFKNCEQVSALSLPQLVAAPQRPVIACIGPITSQTARDLGLPVDIEAQEFTIDGLVEAIVDYTKH